MAANEIPSDAVRRASLRSERIRILGMVTVLVAFLVILLVRKVQFGEFAFGIYLLLNALIFYEVFMFAYVSGRIRQDRSVPIWAWVVNIVVESLFPTLGILWLSGSTLLGPYRSLVAPVALIFFLLIILSILRLSPSLSILTGVVATVEYVALVIWTFRQFPVVEPEASVFSLPIYVTYASMLLIAGFASAGVAWQIRGHVGAALREAKDRARMQQDLGTARSIQQGLLPKEPPQIPGYDVAGWNRPADETGGDYFDWQELDSERLAFTLADVTGHGIGSALVAAACRSYIRASLPAHLELGSAMKEINSLLSADLPPGKLVQAAVGILDAEANRIELLSAGHGPLLVYTRSDDRIEQFNAHGLPFGVFPGAEYGPAQRIDLAAGDILVLITDGFIEWNNGAEEEFGIDRLTASLRAASDLPAGEIIRHLRAEVERFAAGTLQEDDLTALVVKRVGS